MLVKSKRTVSPEWVDANARMQREKKMEIDASKRLIRQRRELGMEGRREGRVGAKSRHAVLHAVRTMGKEILTEAGEDYWRFLERKYPWQAKPRIVICIPCGATSVEKRAVFEAAIQAGARQAYLIEEPMAAAMGADLPVTEPTGSMVVDIGGGTTEVAVISLGGIVTSSSLRLAGNKMDEAISMHLRDLLGIKIGERTAEDIKIKIGCAFKTNDIKYLDVRGRNLVTGLPVTVRISSEETREALEDTTAKIVDAIHSVLEKTPPELASDIGERGIVLTGGGSLLRGLEELISDRMGINTMTAEEPMTAVAIGTGKYVEFLAGYKEDI